MNKIILLAALFACAHAAPHHMVLPRPPANVILNGQYQLIPEDKIVGGSEVVPNSLPFQISLQRRSSFGGFSHSCGGSILNENTILNAAHCVVGITDLTIFRVVAGEHSLSVVSGLEQNRDVSEYLMHPDYVQRTFFNDIALIYLASPLDLSVPSAKAVNMPPPTSEFDPPAGTITTVSGWGRISTGGSISNVLLSVDVPIVSDSDCNAAYAGVFDPNPIFPSMLCAGAPAGGVDSCQGDSGGPLFTGTGADAVQHGIVSFGPSAGCALAEYPGVYTQVSYFLDWIAANKQ
ncbi:trypsin [Daphnia pulex]|uniref:Trypsin n=1 Tax=Daphnia pulex TaxID=6669 RepID=E9H907_DAPPU|nr:trypsin [Daphnia pulex]|eukprot:EFX71777.1 trypsin [Daphnia pulex]